MRLEEHPFHILGITTRTGRQEILTRAAELSASGDAEKISACRTQLMHPARRLDAEVSWFPGISASRLCRTIAAIGQETDDLAALEEQFYGLDCLSKFNAIGYWLTARKRLPAAAFEAALDHLTQNLLSLDFAVLTAILNADRSLAGLPAITDAAAVESAVQRRRVGLAASLAEGFSKEADALSRLLNQIVSRDTGNGSLPADDFIGHFVDRYEIEVQPLLNRYCEQITARSKTVRSIAELQSAPGARIGKAISELEQKLAEWCGIARPIQLLAKSRGLRHVLSIEVGGEVRQLAVALANEFGLHEEAQLITKSLRGGFEMVAKLDEELVEDLKILENLIGEKDLRKKQEEERKLAQEKQRARSAAAGAGGGSGGQRPTEKTPGPSASDSRKSSQAPSVEGFVRLCRMIAGSRWKRANENDGPGGEQLAILEAAYSDYLCHVPPWLAILCSTHASETDVLMAVRNAAAECLFELARRFHSLNSFERAKCLASEARPLVLNNKELGAKIDELLRRIAEASQPPATPATGSAADVSDKPGGSSSTAKPAGKERAGSSWRAWSIAIALFIAMLILFASFSNLESEGTRKEATAPNSDVTRAKFGAGDAPQRIDYDALAEKHGLTDVAPAKPPATRGVSKIDIFDAVAQAPLTDVPLAKPLRDRASETAPGSEGPPDHWRKAAKEDGLQYSATPLPGYQIVSADPEVKTLAAAPTEKVRPEAVAEAHGPVRLPNGTNLAPRAAADGLGRLQISNYGRSDAAVKLKAYSDEITVRFVYIRAKSDITTSKISPGAYIVQFATGKDWNAHSLSFRQDRGFAEFGKKLSFDETPVPTAPCTQLIASRSTTYQTATFRNSKSPPLSLRKTLKPC